MSDCYATLVPAETNFTARRPPVECMSYCFVFDGRDLSARRQQQQQATVSDVRTYGMYGWRQIDCNAAACQCSQLTKHTIR